VNQVSSRVRGLGDSELLDLPHDGLSGALGFFLGDLAIVVEIHHGEDHLSRLEQRFIELSFTDRSVVVGIGLLEDRLSGRFAGARNRRVDFGGAQLAIAVGVRGRKDALHGRLHRLPELRGLELLVVVRVDDTQDATERVLRGVGALAGLCFLRLDRIDDILDPGLVPHERITSGNCLLVRERPVAIGVGPEEEARRCFRPRA